MDPPCPTEWSCRYRENPAKTALAAAALFSGAALAQTSDFATAMAGAMQRMHQAMAVPSTGDPDRDFAAMMIPHHQAPSTWPRRNSASARTSGCAAWRRESSSSSGRRSP